MINTYMYSETSRNMIFSQNILYTNNLNLMRIYCPANPGPLTFIFNNQRSGKRTADEVQPLLQDPRMLQIFYKAFEPYCYDEPKCNFDYPYRLTCGACNNLRYPLLGKAFTVYRRIVPSNYEDGIVKLFNK